MARELKVYAVRDFARSAWLPRDVLDALDEPNHHWQGRILVWATTARAAFEYLNNCGLNVVRSARELGPAMGYDIQTLNAAFSWPEGTILATNSFGRGPVVEVVRQAGDQPEQKRRLRVVGHLDRPDRPIFTPVEPIVTDAMVDAAADVLAPDFEITTLDELRAALAAALKAQRNTS
jgi:hypothetical protein